MKTSTRGKSAFKKPVRQIDFLRVDWQGHGGEGLQKPADHPASTAIEQMLVAASGVPFEIVGNRGWLDGIGPLCGSDLRLPASPFDGGHCFRGPICDVADPRAGDLVKESV